MSALAWAAVASAGFAGAGAGLLIARSREERLRRRALRGPFDGAAGGGSRDGLPRPVGYAVALSRGLALGTARPLARGLGRRQAARWLEGRTGKAGLSGTLTAEGLAEAMARLGLAGGACGALLGWAITPGLAAALGLAGTAAGAAAVPRAVTRLVRDRAQALEASLSEMLEVVALGLRSGLSFDRSFALYGEHFRTELSRSCAACRRRWAFGLATREEALRDLAASYDSALFERVVGNMVRSLRFGSRLAESLEQAAAESRAVHRARVEERVAKAPVKMMLPTAALILPAMLLLVLGPVLLELMEGL